MYYDTNTLQQSPLEREKVEVLYSLVEVPVQKRTCETSLEFFAKDLQTI